MGELNGMHSAHAHARGEVAELQEQIETFDQRRDATIQLHSAEIAGLRSAFALEVVAWEETVRGEQEAHNRTRKELNKVRNDLEQSDEENIALKWSVLLTCVLAACCI